MDSVYGNKMMKITKVMFLLYIFSSFTYASTTNGTPRNVTNATTPATQSSSAATSVVTSNISTTTTSTTSSRSPGVSVASTATGTNATTGKPPPGSTTPAAPICGGSSEQRMAIRFKAITVGETDVNKLFDQVYNGTVPCYSRTNITGIGNGSVVVNYTVLVNHNMNALERSLLASLMYLRANASAGGTISVGSKTFTILQVVAYTRNNQEVNITGPCSLAVAERGCNTGTCQYSDTSVSCRCPSTHEGTLCERQRQNNRNVIIAVVTVVVVVVVGVVVAGILWRCVCGKSKKVQAS